MILKASFVYSWPCITLVKPWWKLVGLFFTLIAWPLKEYGIHVSLALGLLYFLKLFQLFSDNLFLFLSNQAEFTKSHSRRISKAFKEYSWHIQENILILFKSKNL